MSSEKVKNLKEKIEEERKIADSRFEDLQWHFLESEKQLAESKEFTLEKAKAFFKALCSLSFERNLQKRVNLIISILEQLDSSDKWMFRLGEKNKSDFHLGVNESERSRTQFHKNFELLVKHFRTFIHSRENSESIVDPERKKLMIDGDEWLLLKHVIETAEYIPFTFYF